VAREGVGGSSQFEGIRADPLEVVLLIDARTQRRVVAFVLGAAFGL
jgi:hypothetical protein